ncbi:MAG: hypothetical protein DRG83_20015 [Deltaproteobacteria bacterium]|nr:MAG: hypothetical protein DRG83_20015 [Deltaproteobacteria bacterium]
MSNQEPVGKFKFGGNSIEADPTGAFTLSFVNGGIWKFDLGEITRFADIIRRIEAGEIKPTEEEPEVFWRTNGTKVIEVWATFGDTSRIRLREGGTNKAYFWISEIPQLLRHLRILTQGAPYHRIARLIEIVEKKREENLLRIDRFPLNNRGSQNPVKVEREFTQETIRTLDVETSFGIGLDYWIAINLEAKFGLTEEQRISESVKVSMEASPGEHIEYRITWKEVTTVGDAIFEISGVKERVPFRLKSSLVPEVSHEVIARD